METEITKYSVTDYSFSFKRSWVDECIFLENVYAALEVATDIVILHTTTSLTFLKFICGRKKFVAKLLHNL
jgi:hypothetical protein